MVKASELRNLSLDELEEKLGNMRKELMQYRFQLKTGKLEKHTFIKFMRRDIARVLTIANEKKKEVKS